MEEGVAGGGGKHCVLWAMRKCEKYYDHVIYISFTLLTFFKLDCTRYKPSLRISSLARLLVELKKSLVMVN